MSVRPFSGRGRVLGSNPLEAPPPAPARSMPPWATALYRIFEYNKARSSGYGREADDPLVTVLSHGGEERFVVLTLGAEYSRVWQQHREDVGTCNIVVYWEDPKSAPAAPYGLKWLVPTGARQPLPDVWLGRERTLAHLSREYKPIMDRVADVAATASWYREHGLVREHPCARGVGRIDLNDDRGRRLDARWGPH